MLIVPRRFQPFKHSITVPSQGPLLVTVANLPTQLRFDRRFVMNLGVLPGFFFFFLVASPAHAFAGY